MKMSWFVLGAPALCSVAAAQRPQPAIDVLVPASFRPAKVLIGAAQQVQPVGGGSASLLVGGSDSCATAEAISGTGGFAFDNTAATTGTEGQLNTACNFLSAIGIGRDVWFLWTAPTTGQVVLSTCGQTAVDTKIAVYDWGVLGSTCPPPSAAAPAGSLLACADDISAAVLATKLIFNAVAGQDYLIQLGAFPGNSSFAPGLGGPGTFSIDYLPLVDATPCNVDDGTAELALQGGAAGDGTCMLARHGSLGVNALVSGIEVVWGSPGNLAGSTLVNGTPASVALWEDPTDDGNPADATLLEIVATTIQNHDTNTFNNVPLSTTYLVSGFYYVGAIYNNPTPLPTNHHPFQVDFQNCEALPNNFAFPAHAQSWTGWNAGAAFNASNLGAGGNSTPPFAFALALPVGGGFTVQTRNHVPLIRPTCSGQPLLPGNPFCFGDGTFTDHTTACPCGNFGAPGNGCAHSFSAAGANMTASGSTVMDDVVLHASGEPVSSFTLMMQHAGTGDTLFHDGVLCASNPLIRLRGRAAVAGEAFFPNSNFAQDSTTTLSIRGGVVPGSGDVRFYAGWYRNASTTFCPPATANVTNGFQIIW